MTTSAEQPSGDGHWVGVSDAATQAGVAAQTVRNWIASGTLQTRTGQGPRGRRTEVNVAEVRRLSSGRARPGSAAKKTTKTAGRKAAKTTRRSTRQPVAKPMTAGPAKKSTATAARGRRRTGTANPSAGQARSAEAARSATAAAVVQAVAELPGVPDLSTLLEDARAGLSALQRRVDQLEASLTALQQARAGAVRKRLFGGR